MNEWMPGLLWQMKWYQKKSRTFSTPIPGLFAYPRTWNNCIFAFQDARRKMCSQRDCYLAFRSFMLEKVQKKKVSNMPQPLCQCLLHKAEGILVFFFFLVSFAVWKGPRCKVTHFGSLCSFPETCSPSVTAFFIKCSSWMLNYRSSSTAED